MRNLFRTIIAGLAIVVLAYGLLGWFRAEDAPLTTIYEIPSDPVVEVVAVPTATPFGLGVTAADFFLEMDCRRVFPRHDEPAVGYWHDGPMGMADAREIELWQAFSKSERLQLLDWCVERAATWAWQTH